MAEGCILNVLDGGMPSKYIRGRLAWNSNPGTVWAELSP